jgi:hypothetical protein
MNKATPDHEGRRGEVTRNIFFGDPLFEEFALRPLIIDGCPLGEISTTTSLIEEGDRDGWYRQWTATAERLAGYADEGARAGHTISASPLVGWVCLGLHEELVFRGYQLTNMAEGLNFSRFGPRAAIVLALVLSAFLFGTFHVWNPNASTLSTINLTLWGGLLLGLGYVLTGRLALPMGLHIAWNFFEGNVFGFPVSGWGTLGATFLSIEQSGPPLFTGGAFGPEAGLLTIAASILGVSMIVLWVRARTGRVTLQTSLAETSTGAANR